MLRGIAQAQTEFNAQGGNVHIQIVNDENSTQIAKKVAQELVKDKSILAVVGSNASNASLAAAPIYQKHGLVMITPTSTSGELSNFGNYIFRTAPTNAEMADTLAEYVVKQAKRKNVAVCFASQAPDNVTFKDAIVIKNAKEALNFCITYYILGIIAWLLLFLVIGIPLLIWIIISSWIKPVIAIYRISQNHDSIHYYSLSFRII